MMLSAANDLLNGKAPAAVILLCDILPSFIIVLVYPLFQHLLPIRYSTTLAVLFGVIGFVCSFFSNSSVSSGILATILISFQQGLGEASFLAFSGLFDEICVSFWSAGTGFAGLLSTGLYALLTQIFNTNYTIIIASCSVIPLFLLIGYFMVQYDYQLEKNQNVHVGSLTTAQKLLILKSKLHLFISLFLVFLFEYSIFQGVNPDFPKYGGQYYTFACFSSQVGVFLSRSSLYLFKLKPVGLYIVVVVQFINLVVFIFEGFYYFLPFEVMLVYTGIAGICGGLCYAQAIYLLLKESGDAESKFILSCATLFLNFGILCASGVGSLLQLWIQSQ